MGGRSRGGKAITLAIGRGFENLDFFEPNDILFAVAISGPKKVSPIIPLQLSFYYHLALFVNNLRRLVNVNN